MSDTKEINSPKQNYLYLDRENGECFTSSALLDSDLEAWGDGSFEIIRLEDVKKLTKSNPKVWDPIEHYEQE